MEKPGCGLLRLAACMFADPGEASCATTGGGEAQRYLGVALEDGDTEDGPFAAVPSDALPLLAV